MIGKVVNLEAWFAPAVGSIEGYAAPMGEIAACTIHFRNGGQLVAAARAVHFVRDAIHIRAGWCGFSLPVTPSLFLFADSLDLCCGASGKVLLTLSFDDIGDGWAVSPTSRKVAKAVDFLSSQFGVPSVDSLAPLMWRILDRKGAMVAAEAMYQMLLRRAADLEGLAFEAKRMQASQVELAIAGILASEEYARLPADRRLLSPFDYGAPPEVLLALVD